MSDPLAPSDFVAVRTFDRTEMFLYWDRPSGETAGNLTYQIYSSSYPNTTWFTLNTTITDDTQSTKQGTIIIELDPTVIYTFKVRAIRTSDAAVSEFSETSTDY